MARYHGLGGQLSLAGGERLSCGQVIIVVESSDEPDMAGGFMTVSTWCQAKSQLIQWNVVGALA